MSRKIISSFYSVHFFQTKKSAEQVVVATSKQGITLLNKSPLASVTDRANINKEETASLLNLFNEETEVSERLLCL